MHGVADRDAHLPDDELLPVMARPEEFEFAGFLGEIPELTGFSDRDVTLEDPATVIFIDDTVLVQFAPANPSGVQRSWRPAAVVLGHEPIARGPDECWCKRRREPSIFQTRRLE